MPCQSFSASNFLFENETGNSEVPKHALEVAFVRLGSPEGNGNHVRTVCVVDLTRELRRPSWELTYPLKSPF